MMWAALVAAAPVQAADGGYSLSLGAEYSRGDFGTGTTASLWYLPLTLQYAEEAYAWSVSVPYLIARSSGDVVLTSMGMQQRRVVSSSSAIRTDSGLGDVTLSGTVRLSAEGATMPWTALTAKVKLATADKDRNLGTGENDYALQLELAKSMFNGYAGYKVLGDPPGTDFRNVAYAAVGVIVPTRRGADVGVELYGEQAALAGGAEKRELTLSYGAELDRRTRWLGHVVKGLADGSPDWGVGLSVKYAL